MINKAKIDKVKQFVTEDVWHVDTSILPASKKFGFTSIRVLIILIKGFKKDNCTMQAAALTKYHSYVNGANDGLYVCYSQRLRLLH